jgi:hypothetical protein
MRLRTATVLLAAMVCTAACADHASAPTEAERAASLGTTQTTGQTATQPADTTRPTNYPASVRVQGRVLSTTWSAGRTVGDTLTGFTPVANARVTLYRNVLIDGRGVSQLVGERTTGADGGFVFESAPGGPYVLSLNVTPDRMYGEALTYVMGNVPEVTATLRVWYGPKSGADSTGGS